MGFVYLFVFVFVFFNLVFVWLWILGSLLGHLLPYVVFQGCSVPGSLQEKRGCPQFTHLAGCCSGACEGNSPSSGRFHLNADSVFVSSFTSKA